MTERLERHYPLLAVAVSTFLFGVALLTAVAGAVRVAAGTEQLRASYAHQTLLREYERDVLATEAAERGYLLTHDERYLGAYREAQREGDATLTSLRAALEHDAATPAGLAAFAQLRAISGQALGELDSTLALLQRGDRDAALAEMRSALDKNTTMRLHEAARAIESQELGFRREIEARSTREWWVGHAVGIAAAAVNVALLLLVWLLMRRRIEEPAQAAARTESEHPSLDPEVALRTDSLSTLASHLQESFEQEKALLARALHDELGGLLIAVKIDLTTLRRRLEIAEADVEARWKRVFATLDTGLNLKRRVVEQLRPTLLDNMGLYAALRWEFEESCGHSGLKCTETLPEHELPISGPAAIALFRIAQEAMTNVVKHAHATEAELGVEVDGEELVLRVLDNGVGFDPPRRDADGAHGLASLRHRVRALRGRATIGRRADGRGSLLEVRVPLAGIQTAPA